MTDLATGPALQITGLTKHFAGVAALAGVDLTVGSGTVHALLGGNGSGKSTLVKVLAGVHRADAGTIVIAGRTFDARHLDAATARQAGFRFVHQDLGLFAPMSVAENFALAEGFPLAAGGRVAWRRLNRRVQELLDRYDIAARPTTVVAELRPAVRTMVAIARALGAGGDDEVVLVLDEPTASLPEQEASTLLTAIRSRADLGQTIVLISHHLQEVLEVADEVTVLRDGRLAGTLSRAKASEKAIVELIAGRTLTDLRQLAAESVPFGADRLTLRGVEAGPLTGIDLSLRAGQVVGLAGLLGSGRSSLLRTIFGAQPMRSGSIEVSKKPLRAKTPADAVAAGLAFVPEDRVAEAAFPTMDLQENMSVSVLSLFWRTGVMRTRTERRATDVLMKDFSVKAASSAAPFSSLSGGNQQKAVLARWMRREPRVLLLDEPTQGVDVVARAEIYHLIKQYAARGGAVLVASSDYDELSILCDRVVILQGGSAVAQAIRPDITPLLLTELVQVNQNVLEGVKS